MRLTRAAQRAQEGNNEATETSDRDERAPLNEISPNASPDLGKHKEELSKKAPAKKTKGKTGAKKGAKGKKGNALEKGEEEEEEQAADITVGNPAADSSADVGPISTSNESADPPSEPVRLTRRQLAKQEEELRQSQRALSPLPNAEPAADNMVTQRDVGAQEEETNEPQEELIAAPEASQEPVISKEEKELTDMPEAPQEPVVSNNERTESIVAETITPSVEVTSEPEPKTLATERPADEAMTPVASRTSSRRASRSPSKSPMRIEESIEAIDALEEALENVEAVTSFNHSSDEKSPRKKVATPNVRGKTPSKTPLAASRVSRTPGAAPKSVKPTKTSLARASSVRTAFSKDVRKGSTETVDYLAARRRPISMSFPTPPPPPKGRAPTRPTFQLSSDAVTQKLKVEKEERLKRQAEGVPKQRPISMPPPPRSTKPPTKPNFQLPGDKIAAELKAKKEERLKREAEAPQQSGVPRAPRPISMPPQPKSTKPLTKSDFQLPGAAVAEKLKAQKEERLKRQEEAEAAKKAAALNARPAPVRKPVAVPIRQQSGVTIPPPSQRSSSIASKRNSIQLSRSTSTSSANRQSMLLNTKSTVTPVDAAQQKLKGREVFNRDKMEKEARERERKEKEDAAKRARAEAAERGRIASREWAEKQKRKLMGV
ncbi:Nn.00g064470.m01.CDS01 [Neocucurbitaria sp. VM-36]